VARQFTWFAGALCRQKRFEQEVRAFLPPKMFSPQRLWLLVRVDDDVWELFKELFQQIR